MENDPTPKRAGGLTRLWHHASDHRPQIVRASVYSLLNKAMDIAPPFLIGAAVDVVVQGDASWTARLVDTDAKGQLIVLAVLSVVVWGLESLFQYLYGVEWRNLAQTIQHELRIEAYDHIQHLDVAFFEDRSSGDLMAILNDDVNQLERFLDVGANEVLQVLTTVVLIGGTFFYIAPSVAWLAFLPIPFILWGSFRFQKSIEPRYADVRQRAAEINSQLANNLGGVATIKSFTAEDREVVRIADASERYRTANSRAIKLSSAFSPLIRVVILAGFVATLVVGGFQAVDGTLAVGLYSVLVFLTQRLLWPLTTLGQTVDLYQRAMASTNRVLDVLATRRTVVDGPQALPLAGVKGKLVFDGVGFSYGRGIPVLTNLSFEIPAGDTVAFVGATGAGKTTLVKLLLRFYDVTEGSIRIDGHDVTDLRVADLRAAIALVSQDVFLFDGTVAENIAYGRPDASLDDIRKAAEVAEVHEFIAGLPDGYATLVGERGQKLSGGQRQRISIARAILSDAPILLLDEATSAVDNETEAAIQRSLMRIAHDRTTIVIAHRLSTIRNADRIYVLADGAIIEQGTHEELVGLGGAYRSLWDVQTGELAR